MSRMSISLDLLNRKRSWGELPMPESWLAILIPDKEMSSSADFSIQTSSLPRKISVNRESKDLQIVNCIRYFTY